MMKRKAKSNKMLSILLTLVMVLGLCSGLGTTAHAAGTADITFVRLANVPVPIIGENCYVDSSSLETFTIPENGAYVADAYWTDRATGRKMTASDTFAAGHDYYITIIVYPNAGYAFKWKQYSQGYDFDGTVLLNDHEVGDIMGKPNNSNGIGILCKSVSAKTPINSVTISDLPQPIEGEPVTTNDIITVQTDQGTARVVDSGWYNMKMGEIAIGQFYKGEEYYFFVVLEPDADYGFKFDTNSTESHAPYVGTTAINGRQVDHASRYGDGNKLYIQSDIVKATGQTPIDSITITGMQTPVAGQPATTDNLVVKTDPQGAASVIESRWYDETLDQDATTFIEGHEYSVYVALEPGAYYVFDSYPYGPYYEYSGTVTFNGETAERARVDGRDLLIASKPVVAINPNVAVQYRAGIQGSTTWQPWKRNGALSGSTGKGLRMEGLQLKLPAGMPYSGGIRYNAQIEGIGWQGWKANAATAGFNPKKTGGKRLESIKIELTGEMAEHYDVWYHMHTQRFGWMGWAKNGEPAGTVGYSFRVEALEVVLLPKGSFAPTSYSKVYTAESNMLSYVRTNSYDNKKWQGAKGEGDVSGTRGQKKTAIKMALSQSGIPDKYKGNSGITYRVYQDGKWTAWAANDKVVGRGTGGAIQGLQVKLTGNMAQDYDVYYRAEVKNGSKAYWMDWAKDGESAGYKAKNLEQIQVAIVPKGDPAPTTENAKQRFVLQLFPTNHSTAAVEL